MTHELMDEAHRLSRDLGRMLVQAPVAQEVPMRLHSRDIDGGGAPEFHPEFLRYLGNASVCTCGRPARCAPNCRYERDHILGHLSTCEPACLPSTRFRPSNHHNHPNRMKRALRQVRALNPKAYDFLYLVVALGYSFGDAMDRLNADHEARGQQPKSAAEYAVMWVSGASLLVASF